MAAYNKFNQFIADVNNEVHNFSTDTIKFYLTNATPLATNTVKANIAEITAGSGYTAGGEIIPIISSTQTGGLYELDVDQTPIVITATGGTVGPFRYLVVYNDTAASDNLISYYDYGSSITLQDTETLTVTPSDNLFTMS